MIYPKKKMQQVNGKTGEVEAELVGGERIFSIPDTAKLVKLAKAAKTDADLIGLGEAVSGMLETQDARKPEFTKE